MKKYSHYALRITNYALLFTFAILLVLTGTTFAKRAYRPVGVVIIDEREAKLNSYLNAAEGVIAPKSRARVFVGKKMQEQYQKYWHGFEKQYGHKLDNNDLIEFTRLSGCTKVLFLVNSDANPDADDKAKNSLTVTAYLCTNDGVQETFTATQDYDNLRARHGTFRKCLSEICKTLNPIL